MVLFSSADGTTARIEVPGGRICASDMPAVSAAAHTADGYAHITARANLQFRRVPKDFSLELTSLGDDTTSPLDDATTPPLGWFDDEDAVSLGGITPFGVLTAKMLDLLAALEADVSLTPQRSVFIHDLPAGHAEAAVRILAPLGMSFDAASPWARVTACIGAPRCRHALSDVRADAARLTDHGRVHVVGCDRACGRPQGPHTEYLATADGEYEITQRGLKGS